MATGDYTDLAALRAEGVPNPPTDPVLAAKISLWSRQIDRWTGRWFYPRELTVTIDGRGTRALLLDMPIIEIESITLLSQAVASTDDEVDLDDVRIYNRHLTQNLLNPDDRNNPKIEWLTADPDNSSPIFSEMGRWPKGNQNIQVVGTFGYTDFDLGSSPNEQGITPLLIQRACNLLVIRDVAKLTNTEDRDDARLRGRVTSLRTRDQSITYGTPLQGGTKLVGAFSGDPEIDDIIAQFVRPPSMGAV